MFSDNFGVAFTASAQLKRIKGNEAILMEIKNTFRNFKNLLCCFFFFTYKDKGLDEFFFFLKTVVLAPECIY